MERQKSQSVSNAEKNLVETTNRAVEIVRIWNYIEESRDKNPMPQAIADQRARCDRVMSKPAHERPFPLEDWEDIFKANEILIRILASSDKPMESELVLDVFELNEDKLGRELAHSELGYLIHDRVVLYGEGMKLILSPEIKEQFK